jgi:predicted glycogen debranching enzyme
MIPNRFNDESNEPEYNTVDASLWFIHAAHAHRRASGDERFYQHTLLPACRDILRGYAGGTRFGIRVDPADGLVTAGDETTQLTWMDARRDGTVFTPRHGKAVEINALWYNALMLMGERRRAEQVRRSFRQAFVGIRQEALFDFGLYDVIRAGAGDLSIRPNQILAVSLPHSPLEAEEQFVVVEVVRRRLLTPYGLRTLAPEDPGYKPHFDGPIFQRDQAYHNGTVWPWLIGPFLEAWLKVNDRSSAAVEQAKRWLGPLLEHLEQEGCLGSISEVFDAEPPHRPGGCFAQAWSVAEVLRLALELEI